jgi:hypothetical protein
MKYLTFGKVLLIVGFATATLAHGHHDRQDFVTSFHSEIFIE